MPIRAPDAIASVSSGPRRAPPAGRPTTGASAGDRGACSGAHARPRSGAGHGAARSPASLGAVDGGSSRSAAGAPRPTPSPSPSPPAPASTRPCDGLCALAQPPGAPAIDPASGDPSPAGGDASCCVSCSAPVPRDSWTPCPRSGVCPASRPGARAGARAAPCCAAPAGLPAAAGKGALSLRLRSLAALALTGELECAGHTGLRPVHGCELQSSWESRRW